MFGVGVGHLEWLELRQLWERRLGLDLMKVLECHSWDIGVGVEVLEWL